MPLHKIHWNGKAAGWAIWHITENEQTLTGIAWKEELPGDIVSPTKRLEWLAGRILVKVLVEKSGFTYEGIGKDVFGKPFLNYHSHPISLSHSYPYVAVQMDFKEEVGIDIEQPKEKLLRIAPRILDPEEERDAGKDLAKNCIYWCAKEALYKIYSRRGLTFAKHLKIEPFELSRHGIIKGKIAANETHRAVNLEYWVEEDFVLVTTKTN